MPGLCLPWIAGTAWRRSALLYCCAGLLPVALPGIGNAADSSRNWTLLAPPVAAPAAGTAPAAPGAPADPLAQRGWRLRAEIDATYQNLRATRTLTHQIDQPNDVTALVLKYIPVGTTFDEAAAVLRAAGCTIGVNARGQGYATLRMKDGLLQVKHTFGVTLVPRTPNDFSVIGSVNGVIYENYRYNADLK